MRRVLTIFTPHWLLMLLLALLLSQAAIARPVFTPPSERVQPVAEQPWPENHYLVLGYHDVEDKAADQRYLSVRTAALNEQMAWLKANGYQAVSVQQILDAHAGGRPLPKKAVLLTFDDGYSSFYTRVLPLLEAYNWPALWAPVGHWVDTPADQKVNFGGLMTERERFADWDMVKKLSQSPLVEIGAHTWNSHFGTLANPQGSAEPAAANRKYLKDAQPPRYETTAEYEQRINQDVARITQKIKQVTGKAPRAWVWPYGAANGTTLNIVKKHGYALAFTLEDGLADVHDLMNTPRLLVANNPDIKDFSNQVAQVQGHEQDAMRVMHVDLDYVYNKDPAQQKDNIDRLIQRVADMHINTVFLQAFADPDGSGTVRELYFPNRWLPMRADLFNYIAWQLQTRANNVKVYAWMPVLAFDFGDDLPKVKQWQGGGEAQVDAEQYQRLSPWGAKARQRIKDIYTDLAQHASFNGVLFHDDALLSDYEDASAPALKAYRAAGFGGDIQAIRDDDQLFKKWTRYKTRYLTKFTLELAGIIKDIRGPQVKTARNIFALPVLKPESEAWFAQNFADFLDAYDWVAPMAMPLMEGVSIKDSKQWLAKLVEQVAKHPNALFKTVFELQARDWRQTGSQQFIDTQLLTGWMDWLRLLGAKSYGYYPDDFIGDHPDLEILRSAFSDTWYPQYPADAQP